MRPILMAVSAVFCGTLLLACDDEMRLPEQEAAGDVSADYCGVNEVFEASCAVCHDGGSYPDLLDAFDLVDVESDSYAGVFFVVPGDAEASLLYQKVAGTHGDKGSQMPLSGDPLSQNNLAAFETWIDDGATTDCEAR